MKRGNIVGENLRRVRQKIGFTQEELALRSGLSQGYINQIESGKRRYTQKSLELIAEAISIPVMELFRKEGETEEVSMVTEKTERYAAEGAERHKKYIKKAKGHDKKRFLGLLEQLPEHIVEHYITLLKLETALWKKR